MFLSSVYQANSNTNDNDVPTTNRQYSLMIWVPKSHKPGEKGGGGEHLKLPTTGSKFPWRERKS